MQPIEREKIESLVKFYEHKRISIAGNLEKYPALYDDNRCDARSKCLGDVIDDLNRLLEETPDATWQMPQVRQRSKRRNHRS